jgi:hypothetical protein
VTAARCQRCATWWSHQCGEGRFKFITRLCPTCIQMQPLMGLAPLSRINQRGIR